MTLVAAAEHRSEPELNHCQQRRDVSGADHRVYSEKKQPHIQTDIRAVTLDRTHCKQRQDYRTSSDILVIASAQQVSYRYFSY